MKKWTKLSVCKWMKKTCNVTNTYKKEKGKDKIENLSGEKEQEETFKKKILYNL